jgi:hypothetical protein
VSLLPDWEMFDLLRVTGFGFDALQALHHVISTS